MATSQEAAQALQAAQGPPRPSLEEDDVLSELPHTGVALTSDGSGTSSRLSVQKSLAQHLASEDETAVYAILLPSGYKMEEGSQLWEGVRLGKFLGAGAQAKVFRLTRDDGSSLDKVIKINHEDLASKMLNNNKIWVGMDREWEIGTQLRSALQEPDGAVKGFMKVCDCLVSSSGKDAQFSGMIMGELRGWEVYKRMDAPEFFNIHYVREMLFQVFSALDRAQRKLGFVHADLGMRNVMEHFPRLWEDIPADQAEHMQSFLKEFGPGFCSRADGSRFPLGPDIEFKIIDFGISKFSPKVAAAAAGAAAQEVVEELQARSAEQKILFACDQSPASIEFTPGDVTSSTSRWRGLRGLLNVGTKSARIRLLRRSRKVQGTAAAGGGGGGIDRSVSNASSDNVSVQVPAKPTRLNCIVDTGFKSAVAAVVAGRRALHAGVARTVAGVAAAATGGNKPQPDALPAASAGSASGTAASVAAAAEDGAAAGAEGRRGRRKKTKKSPIETMYRHWWHRKGDVFHLLLTMALVLDGRTWPEDMEDEVEAYCSLTHHVTGIKMKAYFSELPAREAAAAAAAGRPHPFGRRPRWTHWWRRWAIRIKAHTVPYNSGLLAREALSHPLFGAGEVRHATVPWTVGKTRWMEGPDSLAQFSVLAAKPHPTNALLHQNSLPAEA